MSRISWKKTFPGMPNSKGYWTIFGAWSEYLSQISLYYVHWTDHRENRYFNEQIEDLMSCTREVRFNMNTKVYSPPLPPIAVDTIAFGNCTTAATPAQPYYAEPAPYKEKQGINPMRVEYNTPTASASVINAKSDEAYQREYLLTELELKGSWRDNKFKELRDLFNIGADTSPATATQLLDAIKNGKFTVDQKKLDAAEKARLDELDEDEDDYSYAGPFFGLTFTDFPKPDHDGFTAAQKAYEAEIKNAKRKIIVLSPTDGLQALLDLEAWLPTGKAN